MGHLLTVLRKEGGILDLKVFATVLAVLLLVIGIALTHFTNTFLGPALILLVFTSLIVSLIYSIIFLSPD